ncbi:MAG: thioredoxin family protein [Candidatus Wallbacteria bacterium]|nr:thioredoxin family protein [Candidatus Wallbacteria bacterium]
MFFRIITRVGIAAALLVTHSGIVRAEESKRIEATPAHASSGAVTVVDVSSGDHDIDKLVKKGATTIVDIFSEACPPCRKLSPKLDQLAQKRKGLRILKLDIGTVETKEGRGINWEAPFVKKYDIHSIPHLILYSKKAKKLSSGEEAWETVKGWLQKEKLTK